MENRYKMIYDIKTKLLTSVRFKQGDIDTSVLELQLTDGGLAVNITNEVIEFRFAKPDKTIVYQDHLTGVNIIDAVNGKVECVLKSNTLAAPGVVTCELHRTLSNKQLTTPCFNFMVEESIGEGIASINYIGSIDNKLIEWQGIFDDLSAEMDDKINSIAEQVNADWDAVTGKAQILNKPVLPNPLDQFAPYTVGRLTEDFETANQIIPVSGNGSRVSHTKHSGSFSYDTANGRVSPASTVNTEFSIDMKTEGLFSFWYYRTEEMEYMTSWFLLDDAIIQTLTGNTDGWVKFEQLLSAGIHTFKVRSENGYGAGINTKMLIDDMSIPDGKVIKPNMTSMDGNGGKVVAVKEDDTGWEYKDLPEQFAPYSIGFLIEDFEDENYVIPFTGEGARVTTDKHAGTYSWGFDKYYGMGNPSELIFTLDIPASGNISFWYKRNGDTNNFVTTSFILDGIVVESFTTIKEWTKYTIAVTAGNHVFKIKHENPSFGLNWQVGYWIDEFSIPANKVNCPNMSAMNNNGGKIVAVKEDSSGWEYVDAPTGGSGGVESFASLTDAPHSYTGQAGKVVKVNTTEDGLEFGDASSAGNIEIIKGNSDGGNPSSTYDDTNIESNALIPVGGTDGQVLAKASASDRDLKWVDVANTMDLLKLKNQTTIPEVTGDDAIIFLKDHKLQVKTASGDPMVLLMMPHIHTVSLLDFNLGLTDYNPDNIWTAYGNAVVSDVQSKFGGKSLHLDGTSGSYASTPANSEFNFRLDDFTIEWWEYRISAPGDSAIFHIGVGASDGGYHGMLLGLVSGSDVICLITTGAAGNKWDVTGQGNDAGKNMGTVKLNQWVHRAICREDMHYYVFEDGVPKSDWAYGAPIDYSVAYLALLGVRGGTYANMYIDEFNVINSLAKYTSSFTPPTVPNNIV